MTNSSFSFLDAKQHLENEMAGLQQQWMSLAVCHSEAVAAKKELLECEIEDRKFAIEKLEAQHRCDCCGTQVAVRETFCIRLNKYSEKLSTTNWMMEKVGVRAECADCSLRYDSQKKPERVVATKDEIVRAIETLTSVEQRTLQNNADRRVRGLGRARLGRDGDDLYQEAFLSTLQGRKKWNRSAVDLTGHLMFAERNISWGWGQKFDPSEPLLDCESRKTINAEGDEICEVENAKSSLTAESSPRADEYLTLKEEIEHWFKVFANDKEATAILQARMEGMTTARQIMQEHNLTKREYEAAERRIRSNKSVLIIEEDESVLKLLGRWLTAEDFAVVPTRSAVEGLCSYTGCGSFSVVMISHSLDLNGVEIAMAIRKRRPSQPVIITTPFSSEEDVVRPNELAHIPILLKPFFKTDLRAALSRFADSMQENAANRCRQKRRGLTTIRKRQLLPTVSASRLTRQPETRNATPHP